MPESEKVKAALRYIGRGFSNENRHRAIKALTTEGLLVWIHKGKIQEKHLSRYPGLIK